MASDAQTYPFGIQDVVELLQLKVRRRMAGSMYVDCPFCGDRRGRMNVHFSKNVWRCNHCDAHGGVLALYARFYSISYGEAFREICEALNVPNCQGGYEAVRPPVQETAPGTAAPAPRKRPPELPQAERATVQEIHQTYSLLFRMLELSPAHRAHLRSPKRSLTDEQIDRLGFRSTPSAAQCRTLTERLVQQGCVVQGVPGFYQNEKGEWTVNFCSYTAGILIPAMGIDGMIRGAQILLDKPLRNRDDPPDKKGAKYIWLSSVNKRMGVTSGSPVHFVGEPFAHTVYVIEGLLKADIVHCLTGRSFAAIAGANNLSQLEPLFALLAHNGTRLIVEAHDMDKFSNQAVSRGANGVFALAMKYGMECRRLTWNPRYKGMDDWQIALKQAEMKEKEEDTMKFKEQYLSGRCDWSRLEVCVERWHTATDKTDRLGDALGLTAEEYALYLRDGEAALRQCLDRQRGQQRYRIYQLDFIENQQPVPFAFQGIEELYKAGYQQPPATQYRLVWEGTVRCAAGQGDNAILQRIVELHTEESMAGYHGRVVSPSDVLELYDEQTRRYFYCDTQGFVPVQFSPRFAKGTGKE